MMYFKLSLKNIRKSFKDYAIYFFTLILGVAIFYVFNSIESQTVFFNVTSSTREIIQFMTQMLSGVSVFVSFILGFLIIFASRFLMKRRNKEFGIYLTLGMSKGKISKILLVETFLIGILSLGVGLGLGVILSQFMSVLVASLFEADMTQFTFIFSLSSMIKSMIYFGIIYVLVMIFNTISVGKCKLIDLLHANKKSEKVKIKNPIVCIFVFLIGSVILGIAYYLVTAGFAQLQSAEEILIPIGLGCIGTFLVIWSLSGFLLKIVMSLKKVYFKGLNSFTLRQLSSKINTTVISMSVICVMLFLTICVLSSALSLKNSMTANLKELAPMDLQLVKIMDLERKKTVTGKLYGDFINDSDRLDSKKSIQENLSEEGFDISNNFEDVIDFYTYNDPNVTLRTMVESQMEVLKKQFPYVNYDVEEDIIRISDYNRLARHYELPTFSLENDEYIVIADFESMVNIRNSSLKDKPSITILGKEYHSKYSECQKGFVEMSSNHINSGIILVPDDAVDESIRGKNYFITNYQANDKDGKTVIENELQKVAKNHNKNYEYSVLKGTSKLQIYESSVGLGAMATFIGMYLGIIFLVSSAAILALKELSESTDNKERYQMLRKIGTDEKVIHRALFWQIAIFFLFPLVLAIIHSIFGIQFCNYILETFGNQKLLVSIIMTAIFLIIIYGGYFLITYWCSKNIIKESR